MKKALIIIGIIVLMISIPYLGIYYITPTIFAKSDIQQFLNDTYDGKFEINKISIQYSPDLFHQPTGYSLVLKDSLGVVFNSVYIQRASNEVGWRTYMGTDILEEYIRAKSIQQEKYPNVKFESSPIEHIKNNR